MLTRCPECATHFRVTPEQLKQRAGRVRCGECQHVFNALDTLIEEAQLVVVSSPAIQSEVEPVAAPVVEAIPSEVIDSSPELAAATELVPAPVESPDPGFATTGNAEEELPASEQLAEPLEPQPVPHATPADQADEAPWDDPWQEPPPPQRRWPWVLGTLLALLALALQGAYAYRVEVAVLWPELRPALTATCRTLGCEIGLPAKIGLVGIEASDLHPEAAQKGRLALTATLKNRAPFGQRYPHLELTLTDTADKPIVRKVLAPADYLPAGTSPGGGMAPGAEIAINIGLDAGDLPASGYRLYIFYP